MRHLIILLATLCLCGVGGCQTVYYNTMEAFGQHKRDLLVDRVENVRDAQADAKEQFHSALEKFSEVLEFQGGQLEEKYKQLKSELEKSESRSKAISRHIRDVENVAGALFDEWDSELDQYTSDKLRRASEGKLEQTRDQYQHLIATMKRTEDKIEPVLSAFRDQVLFLKHNLNAQAVASLQDEFASVKNEIAALIREMEISIAQADVFIRQMGKE